MSTEDAAEKPQKTSTTAKVVIGIIIAIPILCFGSCTWMLNLGKDAGPTEGGAIVACREAVRSMLKSPSSAQFSKETATPTGDTTFEVYGIVDAENSFGASLRHGFTCTAASATGDTWSTSGVRVEAG